ncbi:olfactory receptor 5I1-like [Pelodytes ibericus]
MMIGVLVLVGDLSSPANEAVTCRDHFVRPPSWLTLYDVFKTNILNVCSSKEFHERNQTLLTEFLLLGFGKLPYVNVILFVLFLMLYILSLMGNCLVILLVALNRSLHSPMYFFLSQMSFSEIFFTSNIVPNMLRLILAGEGTMSVSSCLMQFCLVGVAAIAQSFILAAMSFDRYVAICNPLHYTKIMTYKLQVRIVIICWLLGCLVCFTLIFFFYKLEFCHSNVINLYYCDFDPLIKLSCSDTSTLKLMASLLSTPLVILPFLFIIVTYISILHAILKMRSTSGKKKAFSTCSSHLAVVFMYYGTLATIFVFKPQESSGDVKKALSLLYTLITPMFNPIIYSLRNQDIRSAIQKSALTLKKWLCI